MDEDEERIENFEEVAAVNSEMRYLALELMKLASQRGLTFEQSMREFIANTDYLQRGLADYEQKIRSAKVKAQRTKHPVSK